MTRIHDALGRLPDDICMLCRRGCFLNYYPNAIPFHPTYQIENGINYGGGSFCFLMSGLLMYIQVSFPEKALLSFLTRIMHLSLP